MGGKGKLGVVCSRLSQVAVPAVFGLLLFQWPKSVTLGFAALCGVLGAAWLFRMTWRVRGRVAGWARARGVRGVASDVAGAAGVVLILLGSIAVLPLIAVVRGLGKCLSTRRRPKPGDEGGWDDDLPSPVSCGPVRPARIASDAKAWPR